MLSKSGKTVKRVALFLALTGGASLAVFVYGAATNFFPPAPPLSPEDKVAAASLKCCLEFPQEQFANARAGNLISQFEIGLAYAQSGGGDKEPKPEALYWLQMAADGGLAMAQNEIGVLYQKGNYGKAQEHHEAIKWFRLAVAQDDELAHLNMARHLADGSAVAHDDMLASEHFEIAASKGVRSAMLELSYRFAEGVGLPASPSDGREWRNKAMQKEYGDRDFLFDQVFDFEGAWEAYLRLEQAVELNDTEHGEAPYRVAMLLTGEQSEVQERLAVAMSAFDLDAALHDEERATVDLLTIMSSFRDEPTEIDWDYPVIAFGLYRAAALMGHADAQYGLGVSYMEGRGVTADVDQARYWLGRAARQNHQEAKEVLASI